MAEETANGRTAADIRADIAETREELGDTVAALADKADVKKQAKARVEEVKSDVREKVESVKESGAGAVKATNRNPTGVIAAGLTVGIVLIWAMRRRRG
jgi:ElaB/YqjD/DUF883 family membrane-anchored ribosome-binding protein